MEKNLPTICPSCQSALHVKRLECHHCGTAVEGIYNFYQLPVLAQLTTEDQEFILNLLKASGSLKELAAQYGISYPTVRNRLDSLIERADLAIKNQTL